MNCVGQIKIINGRKHQQGKKPPTRSVIEKHTETDEIKTP